MASAPPRPISAERLSRSAMMAFAAASLGAAACGGETTRTPTNPVVSDAALDGANAGGTGGVNAATGGQFPVTFYGAPFPPTGGAPNGSGGAANAAGGANTGTGGDMTNTIYGAAPIPDKQ